jgi:hypothetical protein
MRRVCALCCLRTATIVTLVHRIGYEAELWRIPMNLYRHRLHARRHFGLRSRVHAVVARSSLLISKLSISQSSNSLRFNCIDENRGSCRTGAFPMLSNARVGRGYNYSTCMFDSEFFSIFVILDLLLQISDCTGRRTIDMYRYACVLVAHTTTVWITPITSKWTTATSCST